MSPDVIGTFIPIVAIVMGVGLAAMRERADELGGLVTISSGVDGAVRRRKGSGQRAIVARPVGRPKAPA